MVYFVEALKKTELENIHNLARSIWAEHYSRILTDGQIQYMVNNFQSTEAIQAQIKDGYRYFQIYSKDGSDKDDRLIGYFSFVQKNDSADDSTISKENPSLFLSKLYIEKTSRNQGIAKSVILYLKRIAQKMNWSSIWLTVNKQNTNSIQAYQKLGFKIYREDKVDIGRNYVMDDYYMKIGVDSSR
ncbi:hypothetical protein BKH42_04085 [Helicobacter sp. 13S00482-2]|uniref:GNAT family N-acetyltransferase n=1 Tax=Helicobacter sp. 13S00482-2 TaxID=1476200 RepID=UPI000BA7DE0B|nr:GNAT family N-acetyltransferase [Helicobacter sp. 13S00482-2]PAF53918.1 hypothetical protein BKH42_04085 [Helicobacter sp. 13S00482-2]